MKELASKIEEQRKRFKMRPSRLNKREIVIQQKVQQMN